MPNWESFSVKLLMLHFICRFYRCTTLNKNNLFRFREKKGKTKIRYLGFFFVFFFKERERKINKKKYKWKKSVTNWYKVWMIVLEGSSLRPSLTLECRANAVGLRSPCIKCKTTLSHVKFLSRGFTPCASGRGLMGRDRTLLPDEPGMRPGWTTW